MPFLLMLSISALAMAAAFSHESGQLRDTWSDPPPSYQDLKGARSFEGDLMALNSDSSSSTLTTKSHKILASGWPSTSQMWPTIHMMNPSDGGKIGPSTHWFDMIEPFIYADKPRSNDYSLLLALNKTIIDILKSHPEKPLTVNLSFEYYFNYDQQKITAPPGIKIEVDRKQLEYLEPGNAPQSIKTKVWLNFNKRILVLETAKLDNSDWLKISLVNRQTPSLVALRHLQVEFIRDNSNGQLVIEQQQPTGPVVNRQGDANSNVQPTIRDQPGTESVPPPPPLQQQLPLPAPAPKQERLQPVVEPPPSPPPPNVEQPPVFRPPEINQSPVAPAAPTVETDDASAAGQDLESQQPEDNRGPAIEQDRSPALNYKGQPVPPKYEKELSPGVEYNDANSAASNDVATKVKPGGDDQQKEKKSRWNIWGKGRRKRDTVSIDAAAAAATVVNNSSGGANLSHSIVLTCFHGDGCDWKPDSSEQIQWSLARMPPSTNMVQSGYYYVSNRQNYGDPAHMLYLWLNQTDSATIADQNSDHCIELALYVTEGSYLNLFQLRRSSDANGQEIWIKGNQLLSWAPTLATPPTTPNEVKSPTRPRSSIPKSQLAAMIDGHNGWTYETLCYGDFFGQHDTKECAGNCAFGFEMDPTDYLRHHQEQQQQVSTEDTRSVPENYAIVGDSGFSSAGPARELVVGVALLQEYSINVPIKRTKSNWLDTWQRDQVEPGDDWKFYPKLDHKIATDNISLMNMFDRAHYHIHSNWLNVGDHLDFAATLTLEPVATSNETLAKIPALYDQLSNSLPQQQLQLQQLDSQQHEISDGEINVFSIRISMKLVDSNFNLIFSNSSNYYWSLRNNETQFIDLSLPVTENIVAAKNGNHQLQQQEHDQDGLFKVVIEFVFDTHWLAWNSSLEQMLLHNDLTYRVSLANVSLSDRCFPNPCQYGSCQQNGTGYDDWNCQCDEQHRGRRCEFGRWCNLPHITPWVQPPATNNKITLKTPSSRQPKFDLGTAGGARVSGKEYCQRKLGGGSQCMDIDLPLNDNLYTEEDRTFICSCQDDYYLSDDSKCRSAHLCNSILCPAIGMICDESKPFNKSQPCYCDEKQDWYPDPAVASTDQRRCIRRQCQDKQRDCQFDAHICLPTLPGERPICKCGPKFALKINDKGQKYCQSTACVLPTLNDCQQICLPDNSNLVKPYTCACHPGYTLDPDGHTCRPQRPHSAPNCRPACQSDTQICTDAGCRCKQGYVGEGEIRIQQAPKNRQIGNLTVDYTQSIKCLNVCSLTYAENKEEFERVESVCPLGLCDQANFQCKCADSSSSALINTKYEPIYDDHNSTTSTTKPKRTSPLCHLKRVCEADSSGYKICRSQGAICVPDYTKAAMFDCVCPPSTEKRRYGQETVSEFTCEPKCSSKRGECLRRQAVCRLVDRDEVRCECLPGLMFDQRDQKCYLAKYSYSFNLLVVNRYYEPEAKFHKLELINANSTQDGELDSGTGEHKLFEPSNGVAEKPEINEILPQFNHNKDDKIDQHHPKGPSWKSIFITEYNQCNITQVIPKSVIDDPYEHDIESYLGYIDQCNEKIHQNVRTYHLNSRLSEDLRQSLRQHLRDFTVTTSNNSCIEIDSRGMYLNCTVYLQSNEPVQASTVDFVLNDCDRHGQDDRYCWIKPRLLLKKPEFKPIKLDHDENLATPSTPVNATTLMGNELNFKQIIPCEIDHFCGQDAYSVRLDDKTSLCSCKCPQDIEAIDVRDLEPKHENDLARLAIKEVCAPKNHCGQNSTFCLGKAGSSCHYDIRTGSRCNCVYPAYEDSEGRCVEITFSPLDSTLIVIIVMLGTGLIVSIAINLAVVAKSKSVFGRSKQYPLNEFPSSRPANRSTGVPNPVFTND